MSNCRFILSITTMAIVNIQHFRRITLVLQNKGKFWGSIIYLYIHSKHSRYFNLYHDLMIFVTYIIFLVGINIDKIKAYFIYYYYFIWIYFKQYRKIYNIFYDISRKYLIRSVYRDKHLILVIILYKNCILI